MTSRIKLGLIGAGISRSEAPRLHRQAGRICGLDVDYELLPLEPARSERLPEMLRECIGNRFAGINVTHPYKQTVARLVAPDDPHLRTLGAINTVLFDEPPLGRSFNTDHSGFMRAFEHHFRAPPGVAAIAGAGGVGRAVAFALASMGASELRLFDIDWSKARVLADVLTRSFAHCKTVVCESADTASAGADGLVNCTAMGMHQHPGTAFPASVFAHQRWAFDAVYTPRDTQFASDARRAGLDFLSGYELYFFQGVDAFRLFTGEVVDESALRQALANRSSG